MSTVLYITVNSKPEELSTSKTVGRIFIDQYKELHPDDTIEELDLYEAYLPLMNYRLFSSQATLVKGDALEHLTEIEQAMVRQANELSDQFLKADKYVFTSPMWSISFPSVLKQYLDCIIVNGKLIRIDIARNKVEGLLDDKTRKMLYIQSSGADIPLLLSAKMNHGVHYLKDLFKFLGIKKFDSLLVEGINDPDIGKEKAIEHAKEDIADILPRF